MEQALQSARQLRSFVIPNAKRTGRELGGGSYGTVEELEIDGLLCAGKTLYDTLIDPENQGAQHLVDKYYKECSLLSDLRHPNIVQFLGICFLPNSRLPVLVMERLQGSLDELLESTADIPLSTKVSILQDVARGLVYLHHHSPSIIHRDLTARNVLLDSAMTARIADLGNSRIADILPGQLAQTMTRGIPGTLVYMPPEVSDEDHKYGPSLDMFSFGHLSLFVAIQVFPQNLLKPTYQDPVTKQVKGRSELERREQYIDTLHKRFAQHHPLVVLIKGCLEYEPAKRPTARQALDRLGEVRATVHDSYSDLNRLQLEKSLMEKEAEVQQIPLLRSELKQLAVEKSGLEEVCKGKDEVLAVKEQEITAKERVLSSERQQVRSLTDECAALKGELEGKTEEISSLQAHVKTVEDEKAGKDEVIAAKNRLIRAKELEISEKNQGLISLQQRCSSLKSQLETVQRRNQSLEASQSASDILLAVKNAHIAALQTELRGKDKILQAKTKVPQLPSTLTFNLPLKWKKPIKMPSGVWDAQAVMTGGKVYIGGGWAEGGDFKVLEYVIQRGQWKEIETPVQEFGMAVANDELIITGGWDKDNCPTDEVWVLDTAYGTWTQPFPAMPKARCGSSAVGYKRWVVVVGGWCERCVDVLDTVSKQWYSATPLPSDAERPSLTVIEDTLYVVWVCSAVSISIPILISDAMSRDPAGDTSSNASNSPTPSKWQLLPATPTRSPTTTTLSGSLVAMGGDPASSTIAMYFPQAEQWLKVAELPTPHCWCTCALIPKTEELMVISGWDMNERYIKSIDLCTL